MYDPYCISYKPGVTRGYWEKVQEEIGEDLDKLKNKWKWLKNKYFAESKRMKEKNITTWIYYNELSFLGVPSGGEGMY